MPVQAHEAVYDGQTYRMWVRTLASERKADRMLEAVNALHRLGTGELADMSAREILRTTRIYGSVVEDASAQGKLIKGVKDALNDMPEQSLIRAVLDEIDNGNHRSREFLGMFFTQTRQPFVPGHRVSRVIANHAEQVCEHMERLIGTQHHVWALEQLAFLFLMDTDLAKRKPEIISELLSAAADGSLGPVTTESVLLPSTYEVVMKVLAINPTQQVALLDCATRLTESEDPFTRLAAVQVIRRIGAAAANSIPVLLDVLFAEIEAKQVYFPTGVPYNWGAGFAIVETFTRGDKPRRFLSTHPDLRMEIVRALGAMGPAGEPAVEGLLETLRMKQIAEVTTSSGDFAGGGAIASGHQIFLEEYVGHIVDAFENIGPGAKAAVPALTQLIDVRIPRARILQAIRAIDPAAADQIEADLMSREQLDDTVIEDMIFNDTGRDGGTP
jgi:hypothetical protein